MISISLCMIVKNEENVLERCLNSYQGIYDELIIVDTGSTDRTKEIAAQYTNQIYDFEWINDFSAARNYAFSLAHGDYIFSADADELLDEKNRKAFLDMKQVLLPEIDIVQMYYVNVNEQTADGTEVQTVYNSQKEYRPKLFKRLRTFQWISPVHETIRLDPIVYDSDIEILHKPETNHKNRDLAIFLDLVNQGIRLENYCLIMLCKELFISGTDSDFISFADAFEHTIRNQYQDPVCQENINCVLARIYRIKGDYDRFFAICMKSYTTDPCAEICMELGYHYYKAAMYEEAIHWFEEAAAGTSFIDVRSSGCLPLEYLSGCFTALAQQATQVNDKKAFEHFHDLAYTYQKQAESWILPEEN